VQRHCTRCGSTSGLERHHKIPRYKGGKNRKSNLEDLCKACHDFKHAEMAINDKLKYYRKRIKLLNHRLDVLKTLNAPNIIIIKGYRSYWLDDTTHEIRR
jgi:5-methylcytosine-specific restriction endonuclease McrA